MKNKAMTSSVTLAQAVDGAKRDLLLQSARDEFADRGLAGATMRGIALRAGCTTGAIYPVFDSKESIYAALLGQSLGRLNAHIASAAVASNPPAAQARAACAAFLDYYLQHRFEVNLGLYAFGGLKRQGVGKDSDRALNQALQDALEQIAVPLAAARGIPLKTARPLVALLFSQMIGALVLQMAGRLSVMGMDAKTLLNLMLEQILPAAQTRTTRAIAGPRPVPKATRVLAPAKSPRKRS